MDIKEKASLKVFADKARLLALEGIYSAQSGHPGGSLSICDILSVLYNKIMNIDPKNPDKADRDRFVLSKGHACPALYAVLALKGYFSTDLLKTLRKPDSILQGHPDMKHVPGVDMSTGSLGQGISAACGMALSAKLSKEAYRVYAICGDGEIHYNLNNLCAVIDYNGLQIDGDVHKVMSPAPVDEKFKAFGWNVIVIDGHDYDQIEEAFNAAKSSDKPTAIISKSVKGKGVSYMENEAGWHGNAPKEPDYNIAVAELTASIKEWEAK